jgi:poly [ADP-ribose] polymerase 2/3/4
MMEKTMTAAGYDVKKLPLGNLSDETVTAGFNVLEKLREIFKLIKKGKTTLVKEMTNLRKLSSEFYTLIPHNFGFAKMENFVLRTDEMVKQKFELIDSLVKINTAINL